MASAAGAHGRRSARLSKLRSPGVGDVGCRYPSELPMCCGTGGARFTPYNSASSGIMPRCGTAFKARAPAPWEPRPSTASLLFSAKEQWATGLPTVHPCAPGELRFLDGYLARRSPVEPLRAPPHGAQCAGTEPEVRGAPCPGSGPKLGIMAKPSCPTKRDSTIEIKASVRFVLTFRSASATFALFRQKKIAGARHGQVFDMVGVFFAPKRCLVASSDGSCRSKEQMARGHGFFSNAEL